jgi:hypothetical protein
MEKINFVFRYSEQINPPPFREALLLIDYTGRLYPKKGIARFWKRDTVCRL